MKRFLTFLALASVATLTLFSCKKDKEVDSTVELKGISVTPTTLALVAGDTGTLTVAYDPEDATVKPEIEWNSSDTGVASVEAGTVTAVSAGSATITATAGNFSASCAVTVTAVDDYKGPQTGNSAWSVIGALLSTNWDTDYAFAEEGEDLVLKNVRLTASDEFKFRKDKDWESGDFGASSGDPYAAGTAYQVAAKGSNIKVAADGIYDIYFNPDKLAAELVATGSEAPVLPNYAGPVVDWDYTPSEEYLAETNLWKDEGDSLEWYYAPNWGQIDGPAVSFKESTYEFLTTAATYENWQAQLWIYPAEDITLDASKTYTFSCKLYATSEAPAYLKAYKKGTDAEFSFETARFTLPAGEIYELKVENFTPITTPLNLLFDFGGISEGVKVFIKDITLVENASAVVVPDAKYAAQTNTNQVWFDTGITGSYEALTFETLVRGDDFAGQDAGINTIFGKEGAWLLRAGDSGIEQNQFQLATDHGNWTTDLKFEVGRWYHIALTYDVATTTAVLYVNGNKFAENTSFASAAVNFDVDANGYGCFISRSYGVNRWWRGAFKQMRLWNVIRTADEIKANMTTDIPDGTSGLLGYWKFNEGSGNTVTDYSGNSHNLTAYTGEKESADIVWEEAPYENMDLSALPIPISEVIAAEDKSSVKFEGIVAGISSDSAIVTDGTNNVYVYKPSTMPAVGDKVTVEGVKTTYTAKNCNISIVEINSGSTLKVQSSGNEVSYPTANDITSTIDSYTGLENKSSEYIMLKGKVSVSGKYTNLVVDGATRQGSPKSAQSLSDVNGKTIKAYGYFVGTSSSDKYINFVLTSYEVLPDAGEGSPNMAHNYLSIDWGSKDVSSLSQITVEWDMKAASWTTSYEYTSWWGRTSTGTSTVNSVFGVEGKWLLRIGDAGIANNNLELADHNHPRADYDFQTGTWYHVAVTYNVDDGYTRFYVNGEQVAEASGTATEAADLTGAQIGNSYMDNSQISRYFDGNFANFRVWNTVRTADQIKATVSSFDEADNANLLFWFKLDDVSDTLVNSADSSDVKATPYTTLEWVKDRPAF